MPTAAPHPAIPPAETLARIIDDLCKAVAAHGIRGLMTRALLFLLWGRLRRTILRVRRLAARIAAGALVARQRTEPPRPGRKPPPRLPGGFAWLVRLVPGTAVYGSQLQHLLTDPEMAALAKAAPMRRLLRPLCQMLGVPPPPIPKRPAVISEPSQPATDPPPRWHPSRPIPLAPAGQGDGPPAAAPEAA